jgi:hypothetical protein
MNNKFPWKEVKSPYASTGPKEATIFAIEGITFSVSPTDEKGRDTGRTRYRVTCGECDCILHDMTTGPSSHVLGHMKETHGFDRDRTIGYQ